MNPITTLTFDCYGTLVRWPETLSELLCYTAQRHGTSAPPAELLSCFRSHHSKMLASPYRPYRMLLADAQREAVACWGVAADEEDDRRLLAGLRAIPPYADVPRALSQLASRYRIVIISNSEDGLIAKTIAGLGITPDVVITAEQAKAYKPSGAMWEFMLANVGCAKHELVHVAAGMSTDISPVLELNLSAVWVNRTGAEENVPHVASRICGLNELASLLDRRVHAAEQ